ncbi:MAG: hypothetical protein OK454_08025, partial [Thaumarchaeota archaeon]|nr:hypothetical protein [Nitrososphaerota archaeon]
HISGQAHPKKIGIMDSGGPSGTPKGTEEIDLYGEQTTSLPLPLFLVLASLLVVWAKLTVPPRAPGYRQVSQRC